MGFGSPQVVWHRRGGGEDGVWEKWVEVINTCMGMGIAACRDFQKKEPVLIYGLGGRIMGIESSPEVQEEKRRMVETEWSYKARYTLNPTGKLDHTLVDGRGTITLVHLVNA